MPKRFATARASMCHEPLVSRACSPSMGPAHARQPCGGGTAPSSRRKSAMAAAGSGKSRTARVRCATSATRAVVVRARAPGARACRRCRRRARWEGRWLRRPWSWRTIIAGPTPSSCRPASDVPARPARGVRMRSPGQGGRAGRRHRLAAGRAAARRGRRPACCCPATRRCGPRSARAPPWRRFRPSPASPRHACSRARDRTTCRSTSSTARRSSCATARRTRTAAAPSGTTTRCASACSRTSRRCFGRPGAPHGWTCDVVHANDWQAGLAPAYLALGPAPHAATLYTIHNLAFQGVFDPAWMVPLGLPRARVVHQRRRVPRPALVHEGGALLRGRHQHGEPDLRARDHDGAAGHGLRGPARRALARTSSASSTASTTRPGIRASIR